MIADNEPFISIITPTYNAEICIERVINSVLAQNYTNFEHIIIDGKSVDRTVKILDKYKHLICISEKDKGIYDAMNKGIAKARGEWLYFIGADDWLYNGTVLAS